MPDSFRQICAEVDDATKSLIRVNKCQQHYKRVLDYISDHPEQRDAIAMLIAEHVRHGHRPGGLRSSMSLVIFLMASLHWPEIKAAAEVRYDDGGNASDAQTMRRLLSIYELPNERMESNG